MSLSTAEWKRLLAEYFQVPNEPIYIAGCFAQHVTLYSQQVRALNLITGLNRTGVLKRGSRVGVIGGGAAGIMCVAAAAHSGAHVTLVDQLSGPMGIQRNNRQRYLHPTIYDWPDPEVSPSEAKLPFFPWRADYAANVVQRVEEQWHNLLRERTTQIDAFWDVSDVRIVAHGEGQRIHWNNPEGKGPTGYCDCDVVVMAVGFGLEPDTHPWQWSYWSDDYLDSNFRRGGKRSLLITGVGDGGLVDLMRVCSPRFSPRPHS